MSGHLMNRTVSDLKVKVDEFKLHNISSKTQHTSKMWISGLMLLN